MNLRHRKPKTRERVLLDERHGFGHVDRTDPRRLDHEGHVADVEKLNRQCAATHTRGGKA